MPMASRSPIARCWARATSSRCPVSRLQTRNCTPRSAPSWMLESSGCAPRSPDEYFSALAQSTSIGSSMLQEVALGTKSLADYTHLAGRGLVDEIRELAEGLQGKRILHVSATAFGGGVSEILYTLVPLMRDVGLDTHWHVIYGREEFYNATKLLHNALQGAPDDLSEEQWRTWAQYNEMNARELSRGWDSIIVHDPQPAALYSLVPDKSRNWIWRCHIDLSTPNPATIEHLLPYLQRSPASVWHLRDYVPKGLDGGVRIKPPAIDPLAPKNMAFSPEDA